MDYRTSQSVPNGHDHSSRSPLKTKHILETKILSFTSWTGKIQSPDKKNKKYRIVFQQLLSGCQHATVRRSKHLSCLNTIKIETLFWGLNAAYVSNGLQYQTKLFPTLDQGTHMQKAIQESIK